jgi:ZIP family zinc transporter
VIQAFVLGALAQSSLILSGLLPYVMRIPDRVIGILAGVGAGALISAVAFDLVPESDVLPTVESAMWLLIGALIFIVLDRIVEQRFGGEGGSGGGGSALGIVLGSVVDGVPESLIFGIQIAGGLPISIAFLAAVIVSNIPQALAPSADLKTSGWSAVRMTGMWGAVVIACGLAAVLGFVIASNIDDATGARAAAIAAGGLLAMLTNSLIPFAYEKGGAPAGFATVVGFGVALAMT